MSCRYPAMTADHNFNVHTVNSTSASHSSGVSGYALRALHGREGVAIGMPQQMKIVWSSHSLYGKRASVWSVGRHDVGAVSRASLTPLGDAVSIAVP